MAFKVLVNFDEMKNRSLNISDSSEEFLQTTVRELKEKFRAEVPGAPDPDHLRVFFGNDHLEDDQTLDFYKITHLSVLIFVLKMPIGKGGEELDPDLKFLQSLLPGLKTMDIKQKESAKIKMQQLVYGDEFHDPTKSGKSLKRTDSMGKLPPGM